VSKKDIYNYGLKLLAKREYSTRDFVSKLRLKFPSQSDEIEIIKNEFISKNWLKYERFAEIFIRDQIIKKNGKQKIIQKLALKGINQEISEEVLKTHFPPEDFKDIKNNLTEKKKKEILRKKPNISEFELNGKVMMYLRGKGF